MTPDPTSPVTFLRKNIEWYNKWLRTRSHHDLLGDLSRSEPICTAIRLCVTATAVTIVIEMVDPLIWQADAEASIRACVVADLGLIYLDLKMQNAKFL